MLTRLKAGLASPRAGLWVAGLALLLALPSLSFGLQTDDRLIAYRVEHGGHELSLFELDRNEVHRLQRVGTLAWWTSPRLEVHFVRPLASLIHSLEFRLWPGAPWAMHLVSSAVYALLVYCAFCAYRSLLPSAATAGLASLMFAIDEGHAPAVGWLASRNTLLAALLSLLALLAHVHAQRARNRWLQVASTSCVVLALLSGEAGVMALAYLLAYAFVLGSGRALDRLRTLWPQLCVFALWSAYYVAQHAGARGASWYRELDAPVDALGQGLLDLPVWLLSALGPSLTGFTLTLDAAKARLLALILVLPLLLALRHTPRTPQRDFFALGAALCLPPLFLTVPQDRLLVGASFGVFGCIALFLQASAASARRLRRVQGRAFGFLHLGLAPLMFIPALGLSRSIDDGTRALFEALPTPSTPEVVLVNSPLELLTMYLSPFLLQRPAAQRPVSVHQLYAGFSPVEVERIDTRTLELRPRGGYGRLAVERVFMSERDAPAAGSERSLTNLHVRVLETNARHMPSRVRFEFSSPLEDPRRTFLAWQGTRPVRWTPPPVGKQVGLAALSLFDSLPR